MNKEIHKHLKINGVNIENLWKHKNAKHKIGDTFISEQW